MRYPGTNSLGVELSYSGPRSSTSRECATSGEAHLTAKNTLFSHLRLGKIPTDLVPGTSYRLPFV